MKTKNDYLKQINSYIDFIVSSNFKEKEMLRKEYPGVIEHDDANRMLAKEIYEDLKRMCNQYKNGLINSKELSNFCSKVMYSKYAPKVVRKVVSNEIYDALDYISELDFYIKK
jgi:hypothetical protein